MRQDDEVRPLPPQKYFDYEGPPEWQAPITEALRRVVDPEMALSILDVGLVYAVRVADGQLHLTMTMTSAACPVADVIVDDIEHELARVLPAAWQAQIE